MGDNSYQVIITNKVSDGQDHDLVIAKLAALFKIDNQKAAKLLQQTSTVIKDNIDESTAKKYCLAIQKTGAHCELIRKSAEPLPEISMPVQAPPDIEHRPFIQVSNTQATNKEQALSLEERDRKNLEKLDQFTAQSFCEACGTIKENASSVCLHCGHDPAVTNKQNHRRLLIKSMAAILLLALLGFLLLPFYQQYSQKTKIQDGLQLAIDTRNKITEFILKTNFWPNQNIDANLPKSISNDVIESITLGENGMFTVVVRASALGTIEPHDLVFTPKLLKDKIVWNCTKGSLDNEFRPESCKIAK